MGCHFLDLPFWALDLKAPLTVEAEGPAVSLETTPSWTICKWTFGARGKMPPVEVTWYDGNMRPDLPEEVNPPDWEWGLTFVGSKGMLLANHARHELHPKEKFANFQRPPETITAGGYQRSWIECCRTGLAPPIPFSATDWTDSTDPISLHPRHLWTNKQVRHIRPIRGKNSLFVPFVTCMFVAGGDA